MALLLYSAWGGRIDGRANARAKGADGGGRVLRLPPVDGPSWTSDCLAISREWVTSKEDARRTSWHVIPCTAVSSVRPAVDGGIAVSRPDGLAVVIDERVLGSPSACTLLAEGLTTNPALARAVGELLQPYLDSARPRRDPSLAPGSREIAGAITAAVVCFVPLTLALPALGAAGLNPKPYVPGWAAAAYPMFVAVAVGAMAWGLARLWRVGVRFDDRGVKVRNYFRTYRVGWPELSSFTDGSVWDMHAEWSFNSPRAWALCVMLRDGRAVTAVGTMAKAASPRTLTAIRQAAARHGIPAELTGAATKRPRAWLDAASEAKLQGRRLAAALAVTCTALAGGVVLTWRHHAHQNEYWLANLSVMVGLRAVAGLTIATLAWIRRRQVLGRSPTLPERLQAAD